MVGSATLASLRMLSSAAIVQPAQQQTRVRRVSPATRNRPRKKRILSSLHFKTTYLSGAGMKKKAGGPRVREVEERKHGSRQKVELWLHVSGLNQQKPH